MNTGRIFGLASGLLLAAAAGASGAEAPAKAATSCVACHQSADFFDETARKIVSDFAKDVHAKVGLSCQDCHGGNPDPALAEDPAAMDPDFKPNPYRGAIDRLQIAAACGRCHSDAAFMRRFRPDLRVDQEQEYRTSHHGLAQARGDLRAATCTDCHGVHGIVAAADPASPVYPKNVALTCRTCHADPQRMQGTMLAGGRPIPVDQFALWRQSVHARALLERDDLSAPTCNDCHGNHGATPPGVESIAFVCGQCHGREAELFRASAKEAGFAEHNDLLASAGDAGCAACHEAPEPQAALSGVHGFSECASCHGNHAVLRPTVAMLAGLPETPCVLCHEGAGPVAGKAADPALDNYRKTRDGLLAAAGQRSADERFDWLVDRALELPAHTVTGGEEGALRPEFERLFTKFRIGKTSFTYPDPVTGRTVRAAVKRCSSCHAASPALGGEPLGLTTGREQLARMSELTALVGRAERILLAARRGGVETRQALAAIDAAVDAQIELEVLVHTFSSSPGSPFTEKHREGIAHARSALDAAEKALGELSYRRRGLAVSLVVIVLLLVGLALKIRQLSQSAATAGAPG